MSFFPSELVDSLKQDFLKITTSNNYSQIIKDVFVEKREFSANTKFPSIAFWTENDVLQSEDESSDLQIRTLDLKIVVYVKSSKVDSTQQGLVTDLIYNSYQDIFNFLYQSKKINKAYTASFRQNPNCLGISLTNLDKYVESPETVGAALITCKVQYILNALEVDTKNVSALGSTAEV